MDIFPDPRAINIQRFDLNQLERRLIPREFGLDLRESRGEAFADRSVVEALGMFEALAARDDIAFRFTLEAGEAILANNYTVLHARTAFEDGPTDAEKRHLLRLWLRSRSPRPVVPEVYIYWSGVSGIPPKEGAVPVYQHGVTID